MFSSFIQSSKLVGATLVGAAESVSSAIAYGAGMEDAHIEVVEEAGTIFLEGTAPSASVIEQAGEIARSIFGTHVCNLVRMP